MEKRMIEIARKVFKDDDMNVEFRLLGGMSNYTYVIKNKTNNKMYTIRELGEYAEKFVYRNEEEIGLDVFYKLGITNKTIYFNKESGEKISEYVPGKPLSEVDSIDYELVSELMKKYHQSNVTLDISYNPFDRLQNYENHLIELGFTLPNEYLDIRNKFLLERSYLDKQEKVLCHNDSQPSNFVLKEDGSLIIVDFEFTGMNDYLYDIACFGNKDMKDAIELFKVYFKDKTDSELNDLYRRLYLWRCYQCLQWYNVAMFKELVGMSKTLCLDFNMFANNYLKLSIDNYNKALEYKI